MKMGDTGEYWRDINEAFRQKSLERRKNLVNSFKGKLLPKLNANPLILKVESPKFGQYILYTKNYGIIDIFINTGSLRVRKENRWFREYKKWLKLNKYL